MVERELIVGVNVPVEVAKPEVPSGLAMGVFPNPFNSSVSIALEAPRHADVAISLYDLLGREVDVIHRGMLFSTAFSYTAPPTLASGIYFLRAKTADRIAIQKLVLLK